jgi:hypothetical protein
MNFLRQADENDLPPQKWMSNFLTYAMKACVCGGITPIIRCLRTKWRSVNSFTTCLLHPEDGVPYSSNEMLGWPQSRSARLGGQRDSWPCRESNHVSSVRPGHGLFTTRASPHKALLFKFARKPVNMELYFYTYTSLCGCRTEVII